jgi:hypothetical protein
MPEPIRNRIKGHRRVRAGDLVPHEFNYRLHNDIQRDALQELYAEVGFARSLLAYELPDGRLKLIDGHLRRDMDPNMEVDVEILDVNEDEARLLLLSIDPLAQVAAEMEQLRDRLVEILPEPPSPAIVAAWDCAAGKLEYDREPKKPLKGDSLPAQFYVLITCQDEPHQVELLRRLKGEGLMCKAVMG